MAMEAIQLFRRRRVGRCQKKGRRNRHAESKGQGAITSDPVQVSRDQGVTGRQKVKLKKIGRVTCGDGKLKVPQVREVKRLRHDSCLVGSGTAQADVSTFPPNQNTSPSCGSILTWTRRED